MVRMHAKFLVFITLLFAFQVLFAADSLIFTHTLDLPRTSVKDQGKSGTCWSFATCSFLESEYLRKTGDTIHLSEMFLVRQTYLNKSEKYVRMHGFMNLGQGGQAHDVLDVMRTDGLVPKKAFSAKDQIEKIDHTELIHEVSAILAEVSKESTLHEKWNKPIVKELDKHIGKVPPEFEYEDKKYTPKSFLQFTGLNPGDYIEITSYTHHPFYEKVILEMPDNWASGYYYNVPMEELKQITDNALQSGYTVCWDGDISEPGFLKNLGVAMLVKNDDPINFEKKVKEVKVDQEYRQKTFDNYETTDDHLMHMVGTAQDQRGNNYYIIKNSWGKNSNRYGGYLYMSEAYFLGKTIAIMVNREGLDEGIQKKLKL